MTGMQQLFAFGTVNNPYVIGARLNISVIRLAPAFFRHDLTANDFVIIIFALFKIGFVLVHSSVSQPLYFSTSLMLSKPSNLQDKHIFM